MATPSFIGHAGRFFLRMALFTLALGAAAPLAALDKTAYQIFIVSDDDSKDKFVELRTGFTESLDRQLAAAGAKASYTVFDTKGDPTRVPAIIEAIQAGSPDLIAVINNSSSFADTAITLKLTDPRYRFISENCMPVQSGAAASWDKPGGNVTGVSVFTQFSSTLKLAKLINPKLTDLYFWTWDLPQLAPLNEFFLAEVTAACAATGVRLAEFKRLNSAEEQFEYLRQLDRKGPAAFGMAGTSVWVHKDGSPANMAVEEAAFWNTSMRNLMLLANEEIVVKIGAHAGACIVWSDLGAQMADKAMKVLGGANPGDLPWSYPRTYNVIVNLAAAQRIGLDIPARIVNGAWRVYTDMNGTWYTPRK